jgi:cytidylate kinase
MKMRGVAVSLEAIEAGILRRDARDTGRKDAPLAVAPDAHVLDTSALGRDEAITAAIALVETAAQV